MLTLYGDGEGNLEMDESAFIGYEVLHAVAYTENTANTGEGFHPERTENAFMMSMSEDWTGKYFSTRNPCFPNTPT